MFDDTMTTERLLFRRPRVDDAPLVFERWAGRSEGTQYMLWPTHREEATTRAFLEECVRAWEEESGRYPWVLARKGDPEQAPVGMLELNVDGHAVSLGYIVAVDMWGRGFATEAGRHVVETALSRDGIWRVYATTDVDNRASVRVLEKIGMSRDGLLCAYQFRPNLGGERPHDAYLYARVADEISPSTGVG